MTDPTAPRRLAVVLAAGEGVRMKSARPKALHEIAGRSMLAHALDAAVAAGAEDSGGRGRARPRRRRRRGAPGGAGRVDLRPDRAARHRACHARRARGDRARLRRNSGLLCGYSAGPAGDAGCAVRGARRRRGGRRARLPRPRSRRLRPSRRARRSARRDRRAQGRRRGDARDRAVQCGADRDRGRRRARPARSDRRAKRRARILSHRRRRARRRPRARRRDAARRRAGGDGGQRSRPARRGRGGDAGAPARARDAGGRDADRARNRLSPLRHQARARRASSNRTSCSATASRSATAR